MTESEKSSASSRFNDDIDSAAFSGEQEHISDGRFAVGDVIMNRYRVLSKLGQGGMGVVYRCLDETAEVQVALKTLPPEVSCNTLEMEDVRDNFMLVAKLVHQNIAVLRQLEKDESSGDCYLVMEYVSGEDLRRWIRRRRKEGTLDLESVVSIIRQVAEALDYAHEMQVIHRDIKPGNIMIDKSGRVKVLDFGVAARIHTSMTHISMAYHNTSGTGPYMSPEQWRGRAQGAAADQYALAVMTYEMLAGYLPFESSDTAILREVVLNETADDIPGVPAAVQRAISRAMSKEPSERFRSCMDFVDALCEKKIKTAEKRSKGTPVWLTSVLILLLSGTAGVGYYKYEQLRQTRLRVKEVQRSLAIEAERKAEELRRVEALRKAEELKKAEARKAEELRIAAEQSRHRQKLLNDVKALQISVTEKIRKLSSGSYCTADGAVGVKFKLMNNSLESGNIALKNGDAVLAGNKFREADAIADWIITNAPLEERTGKLFPELEKWKAKANIFRTSEFASGLRTCAGNQEKSGRKYFSSGDFVSAETALRKAIDDYRKAYYDALDLTMLKLNGSIRSAEEKKDWKQIKQIANEIRPYDAVRADNLIALAEKQIVSEKVAAGIASARGAAAKNDWKTVLGYAGEVLKIAPDNSDARNLQSEAVSNLKPKLEIIALIDGKRVPAVMVLNGKTFDTSNGLFTDLAENGSYSGVLKFKLNGDDYAEKISFTCNWNGLHRITANLRRQELTGITLPGNVELEIVRVEPGSFTMSKMDGKNYRDEVEHVKTVTKEFYIGKYEVTQAQWNALMKSSRSLFRDPVRPVERISWNEAMEFCRKLTHYYHNELDGRKNWYFTLPTETQWEFAARGGRDSRGYIYSGSNLPDSVSWSGNNASGKTHPVGKKQANELGLFDMSGNVHEWCLDDYENYSNNSRAEFSRSYSKTDKSERVYRGGSWHEISAHSRSGYRNKRAADKYQYDLGFRVVLVQDINTGKR